MANKSEAKTKRNNEIYKDYKSGKYSMAELIGKYKISQTRIYQIIERLEKK